MPCWMYIHCKMPYLRIRWWCNQTLVVSSYKGCSHFTDITWPWVGTGSNVGLREFARFWLCFHRGHLHFTNRSCSIFGCIAKWHHVYDMVMSIWINNCHLFGLTLANAFVLVCCGCDTSYIVSVHIHCQASIYTLLLCRGHSSRVQLAKQETLTPPGHLVSLLVFRGQWMSTMVLYCWCHSDSA